MTEEQLERYNRHIILKQVGVEGQEKLLNSRVLVVGAGGLGSPVLLYLTAAGIGTIGIIDADVVSISNLQRQVLYREHQLGEGKAEKAKETLLDLNKEVDIKTYPFFLTEENAEAIISEYEVVVGATDNFNSRIFIDGITKKLKIPFVHGSIQEFEGQVSVFNYKGGPSYSDLFPVLPADGSTPKGVIGYLPGVVGSFQAAEVIKILLEVGEVLSGRLLVYNSLNVSFSELKFG